MTGSLYHTRFLPQESVKYDENPIRDLSNIFRTFSHGEPNDKHNINLSVGDGLYSGDDLGMVYGIGKSWELSTARRD